MPGPAACRGGKGVRKRLAALPRPSRRQVHQVFLLLPTGWDAARAVKSRNHHGRSENHVYIRMSTYGEISFFT